MIWDAEGCSLAINKERGLEDGNFVPRTDEFMKVPFFSKAVLLPDAGSCGIFSSLLRHVLALK